MFTMVGSVQVKDYNVAFDLTALRHFLSRLNTKELCFGYTTNKVQNNILRLFAKLPENRIKNSNFNTAYIQ
jgi:hypothetical protein